MIREILLYIKRRGLASPFFSSSLEDKEALNKLEEEIQEHLNKKTTARFNDQSKLGKFKGFTTGGKKENTSD